MKYLLQCKDCEAIRPSKLKRIKCEVCGQKYQVFKKVKGGKHA